MPDPVAGAGRSGRARAHLRLGTHDPARQGRTTANPRFPRIIGHEITGEIVQVGAGVTASKEGDAVTAYYYLQLRPLPLVFRELRAAVRASGGNVGINCDGGYAEYIKLPAHLFIKLPEGLDYKAHPAEIGVVMDALATPYKVLRRARVTAGETVAVIGAGGGLGIHQVMMAKWARARVIAVDTARDKFDACRKAGADEVVDASDGTDGRSVARSHATAGRRCRRRLRVGDFDAGSRREGARTARAARDARRRGQTVHRVVATTCC